MRLGIIAAAAASGTSEPALGERDAHLLCERLALQDMGFVVHVVDPSSDMAEQIDVLLADYEGQLDDVLLYVSALTVTLDDGQCFFCLDVTNPDVGDGVADVARAIARHVDCRSLIVVEGRNEASDAVTLRAAASAIRDAVAPQATGVETIVSMRSLGAHPERIPSRFTVGLLEEIDSRPGELHAKQAYAAVMQHADLGAWPHAEVYASGRESLPLRDPAYLAQPSSRRPPDDESGSLGGPRSQGVVSSARPTSSKAAKPAPAPAEPPPPPIRAPKRTSEFEVHPNSQVDVGPIDVQAPTAVEEAPIPEFPPPLPEPVPVPESSRPAADDAPSTSRSGPSPASERAATPQGGKSKKQPRRPAPPSERVDAATVTMSQDSRPKAKPLEDTGLPKVVIAAKVDPRRRPTVRKFDPETVDGAADGERRRSIEDDSAPPPPSVRDEDARDDEAYEGEDSAAPPSAPSPARPPVEPPPPPKRAPKAPPSIPEPAATIPDAAPTLPDPAPSAARLRKKATEWTVQDHVDAGDERFAEDDLDGSHAEYKKALGKLGTATTPARAELYVRIGNVNRRQGNGRMALSNYEKALAIVADLEGALDGLLEVYVDQGNWRAVQSTEDKLLASLPEREPKRLERLLEFGDRVAARGNLALARERFEQARDEYKSDVRPLERLLAMHEKANAVADIIDVRRAMNEYVTDPRVRARAHFDLARFCLDQADRDEEALALFERAIDDDPELLEALEILASTLADNQEWAELERIYRKMIAAYVDRPEPAARVVLAELHRKLALLFRDHLEDPEQALEALSDDLKLRPDDLPGQLLAAELAVELEDPARALIHLRRSTELEPMRVETYRQLFDLGERFEEPETAFLAASVLSALGAANDAENAAFEQHRVQGVPLHQRALRQEAWSWLRDKKHDRMLDRVMRAIAPAVLRARVLQLEERGKLAPLPERQDPKTSTASVVRSIGWASQFLGIEAPAIYLDDKVDAPLVARFAKHQAMVVGKGAMRGRSVGELGFLAGRHLALRLPEHELVAHMQTIDELSACFLAGIKLTLGAAPSSGPLASIVDGLAKVLGAQMAPDEQAELELAVKELTARSAPVDLGAWVASVERCATRAGFVLCGDLGLVKKQLEAEGDSAFSTARSRIADLCAFAVGGAHMKLRQEFGSSLLDAPELPRLTMV